jgi:hypothetical protein
MSYDTNIGGIHEHINQVFRDFPLWQEHLEDLVPVEDPVFGGEDLFQGLCG